MKVLVDWKGTMAFEGKNTSGKTILLDAPVKAGGEGNGPSPMEAVLMALGGCTGMDVVSILKKMKLELDDFKIEIEGKRAENHPKVFTKINIKYIFIGKNLDEKKVSRAVQLTQDRYCSVLHMINKTAEVSYSYEIR